MGNIITFYSYKGGVGRSMALANIAVELAKKQKRVLIVDWDLEAPGLQKYFSGFRNEQESEGLIHLLTEAKENPDIDYEKYVTNFSLGLTDNHYSGPIETMVPHISMLHSGRENDPIRYSRLLERFNWTDFFKENAGGDFLERLRNVWIEKYDHVLIDSRTGLSDASGICTIMMPDILVPIFTANEQSLFGLADVINYIHDARQRLHVDRMALTILPIPSRFGTRVEFKESQTWLDRMAEILRDCFSDWLPKWIEPRYVFEQIKIPQVDYFTFGEKLAVVEQGTSDPESMGYIYSKIAKLLDSNFRDIESFVGKEYFDQKKTEYESRSKNEKSDFKFDIFISYSRSHYSWVRDLFVPALEEYLVDKLERTINIFTDYEQIQVGDSLAGSIENALKHSKIILLVQNPSHLDNDLLQIFLSPFKQREQARDTTLIFPILVDDINQRHRPEEYFSRHYYDLSSFSFEETIKSTKRRSLFGQEIEKLSNHIARSLDIIDNLKAPANSEANVYKLYQLAKDYDSIRQVFPSGAIRTEKLDDIVERMRQSIDDGGPQLSKLTASGSAGKRLLAIVYMQEFPEFKYLDWLVSRIGNVEKPYLAHQAAKAIHAVARESAKNYPSILMERLRSTIDTAKLNREKDAVISTLQSALNEVFFS